MLGLLNKLNACHNCKLWYVLLYVIDAVFRYPIGKHNVFRVNGTQFQQCTISAVNEALTSGYDVITLATSLQLSTYAIRDAEEYKNFCDRPRDQRPQPEEVIRIPTSSKSPKLGENKSNVAATSNRMAIALDFGTNKTVSTNVNTKNGVNDTAASKKRIKNSISQTPTTKTEVKLEKSASANHVEAKGQIEVNATPVLSHGRRVRIENQYEAYRQEQHHEGDSIQTETYMSDDEYEEENTGSTSHVTRKEARALGETRKSRLNKGSLVFEYAKLDGTTWKKKLDLLKTDIISKITMLPEFCLEQFTADLKICTTNLLGLLKMTWNLWSALGFEGISLIPIILGILHTHLKGLENCDFDFKCTRTRSAMSSQLGYQHRNHQYKLHLHYKEYETVEEAMTHPPKGIEVSDWVLLCEICKRGFPAGEKEKKFQKLNGHVTVSYTSM
ncbi:Myb domain protein 62, partial [Tanacetum coccineum]